MRNKWSRIRLVSGICLLVALALVCALNLFEPRDPSPEWLYTIKVLNRLGLPAIFGLLAILLLWSVISGKNVITSRTGCILIFLGACIFIAIPLTSNSIYHISWQMQYFLSFCWAFGLLCAGLLAFILATRLPAIWATLGCLAGSIFFAFSAMEAYLLFTSQPADGINNASAQSHYVTEGAVPEPAAWESFVCGSRYAAHDQPTLVAHRLDKFGKPVFDVQYGIRTSGRRRLPDMPQGTKYDLLLFGCSYTFGHSLEDEQTWPWHLATLLGSQWSIENYAMTGWSINQTLCLLEHDLVEIPRGKENFAIYLAIKDHVRRNDFFPGTPVYHLDEKGEAESGGKPAFNTLHRAPEIFNGSQLAREIGGWASNMIMKHPERMTDLYLGLLKKTADLLKEKYNTRLIVLIWPDIQYLASRIAAQGIPVLDAKEMMEDWDKDPGAYYISPFDGHPNAKAATALARGVARYLRRLVDEAPSSEEDL